MSVISSRSGTVDRVCRSVTCAETRAMVDLEDELFSLRYQRSEMLGNNAVEHSPDKMAGMVSGSYVADSEGLYDKMQHTMITPQGKSASCRYRVTGFEGRIGDVFSRVPLGARCCTTYELYSGRYRDRASG